MKKLEMFGYLKKKFEYEKDNGSFEFFLKNDSFGFLSFIPNISGTEKNQQLLGVPLMSFPWCISLELEIFQYEGKGIRPFDVGVQYRHYPDDGFIGEKDIDKMIASFFLWFEEQSKEEIVAMKMSDFYKKETDLPPARWQFKHIVACVLKGDSDTLLGYLNSFKSGDRMNFIPLIKQEHFERAISISLKYKSGELKSPVKF